MERPHRPRPTRAGFTLIELLVAILIIGALLGLLLPVVSAAFRRAKEASVSAEMNNLATALASFKNTYGDYPPSRIILSEVGYAALLTDTTVVASGPTGDTNASDMTVGQLAQRSLTYLQKFFPRANLRGTPVTGAPPGQFNDFNGNATIDQSPYIISGSECLAFFLGGIPIRDPGTGAIRGMSGFSRSPTFPFVFSGTIPGASNQVVTPAPNRTTPNYEFVASRLVDLDNDGIPSYVDPLDLTPGSVREYAYFSAYGTNQYDPNDVNGYGSSVTPPFELEEDGSTIVERGFSVTFPTSTGSPYFAKSVAPNPYTTGPAAIAAGGTGPTSAVSWHNQNSFQILCAGPDRLWGLGGMFVQNATGGASLPILPAANDPGNIHGDDVTGVRQRENDNITNFSGGRLQ